MEGWIIDLEIRNSKAILWFKTVKGSVFKIFRDYKLWLHIPENRLEKFVFDDDIYVESVKKKIFPNGKGRFFKIWFDDLSLYNVTKERFKDAYDSDLLHSQKFLFQANLIPLARYDYCKEEFKPIDEKYRVKPPDLSRMFLSLRIKDNHLIGFSYISTDEKDIVDGNEENILRELMMTIQRIEPDIILVDLDVDEFLRFIVSRAKIYYDYYGLGRSKVNVRNLRNYKNIVSGRLLFSYSSFVNLGLTGLEERCRFSMLPPSIAFNWTAGRLVDSRQCYIAYKKGYVIPPSENLNLIIRSAWEIHLYDKGGVLQTPIIGLHENVAVLDFESMFPNIIVRYNVSYETVRRDKVVKRPRGLLIDVVEPFLKRRLHFKHLKKRVGEPFRSWADQRQNELKLLLVSCYGYSGNNFNRFGNPLTFEWINRISRVVMSKVYEIARTEGFEIIYSDTDSIFVRKNGADKEDFERLARMVEKATRLPIKVDRIYKFLVLLPSKNNNLRGVGKRYYGRLIDGSLDYKGIELNRQDVPEYVKKVQLKVIDTLLDGESIEDVYKNIDKCEDIIREAVEELRSGRVPVEKLILRKFLRRKEYKVSAPHYIAVRQLFLNGYEPGNVIEYIYVNSKHKNPIMRIQAWQIYDERSYDKQKYVRLLMDSVKYMFPPFALKANFHGTKDCL